MRKRCPGLATRLGWRATSLAFSSLAWQVAALPRHAQCRTTPATSLPSARHGHASWRPTCTAHGRLGTGLACRSEQSRSQHQCDHRGTPHADGSYQSRGDRSLRKPELQPRCRLGCRLQSCTWSSRYHPRFSSSIPRGRRTVGQSAFARQRHRWRQPAP